MFRLLASLLTVTPIDDVVQTVTLVDDIDPNSTPKHAGDIQRVKGYVPEDEDMTANDWRNLNK